jgi:uncharacterized membrane protein
MALEIAILVLLAAFLHAVWNALVKTAADRMLVMSAVAGTQCLAGALALFFVPLPDPAGWPAIALSTLLHYFYYAFLLQAYKFGDLSQVYPLARGLAPLLVAVGAALFAGERLTLPAAAGVVITSAGIVSIAFFQGATLKRNHKALFFALGTGAIIAAYTVADGIGVRLSGNPFSYMVWLFFFEFPIVIFTILRRKGRLISAWRIEWKAFVGTGLCSLLAYALVIYSVAFAPIASVSALRESSVIMAALIGTFLLGERPWQQRVAAAVVVAGGVAMITGVH